MTAGLVLLCSAPGAVLGTISLIYAVRTRGPRAAELRQAYQDQGVHASLLWPQPWLGNRPLTQVERIAEASKTWLGEPLRPAENYRQMAEDAPRLLESYRAPLPDTAELHRQLDEMVAKLRALQVREHDE